MKMQTSSCLQTETKRRTLEVSTVPVAAYLLLINPSDDKPKKGDALEQDIKEKKEKAAHYAENREYGESISEHGFGGQTTSTEQPQPQHRHYGRDLKDEEEEELAERKKQGYGKGSGVGG